MKLVLYNPRSNGSGKRILPLSLLALGAVLEGRHEYTIVDGNAEREPLAALDRALRDSGAGVLAMTPIPDPQELPDFPYHRVPVGRYARDSFLGKRTLPHHSSYGCPFFCNFCAVVNMVGGRWLPQTAERTATVARYLHDQHGADAVEFYDNNFFVHEARTVEFAERSRDLRS